MARNARTSVGQPAPARARLLVGAWVVAASALGGCKAYPTIKPLAVDCSAEDGYDFDSVDQFEDSKSVMWFGSGDDLCSDGGIPQVPPVQAIENGGRCGSSLAAVFSSKGCNDWGGLFGDYAFGLRDESGYEGVSFWARAPGNTAKAFTIVIADKNTAASPAAGPMTNCKDYDGGTPTTVVVNGVDQGTGAVISGTVGAPAYPDACGNGYNAIVEVTSAWGFYTVPFDLFQQVASPNRVPNEFFKAGNVPGTGLLTSELMGIVFRMPKESRMELWVDNLSFYRHKGWTATATDGGADAAQQ